jgi:hypothetical protein
VKVARCTVMLLSATAFLGVAADGAVAALPTPTTVPAQSVTVTGSTLKGTVDTGGAATLYQFQYGRSTSYGSTTSAHVIPSGQGTVSVSAKITGLLPARRYHFRLAAQSGPGTQYYPLVINFAADRSFVTLAGKLTLSSSKLTVRNGIAPAELTCVSSLTCKGTAGLTLATGHGKRRHLITLAKTSFSVRAHHHPTSKLALSGKAISLLTAARGHRLGATFVATTSTRQSPLSRPVTLILG